MGRSWSYGSWIHNCLSPLTWGGGGGGGGEGVFSSNSWPGVLDTTLCDKVWQWLASGRCFSQGTLVSSTNKIYRHNWTEILLKVALSTKNQPKQLYIGSDYLIGCSLGPLKLDFQFFLFLLYFNILHCWIIHLTPSEVPHNFISLRTPINHNPAFHIPMWNFIIKQT